MKMLLFLLKLANWYRAEVHVCKFYEGVSSIFDLITKKLCDITAKPVRLIKDN